MDDPIVPPVSSSSRVMPAVVCSSLLAAILAGGGVSAYQKNQADKVQADFQTQIDSLKKQLSQSKAVPATATPLPTTAATSVPSPAIPTPAPSANPTAGWQAYSNLSQGFEVKYPADWGQSTASQTNITLNTQEDIVKFKSNANKSTEIPLSDISIEYYASPTAYNNNAGLTTLKDIVTDKNNTFVNAQATQLAGEAAYSATQGGLGAYYTLLVIHNTHLYVIRFEKREKAAELTATEKLILNSFRFTK